MAGDLITSPPFSFLKRLVSMAAEDPDWSLNGGHEAL
jgi:hypothetical protein